jgi:hypothetical protein
MKQHYPRHQVDGTLLATVQNHGTVDGEVCEMKTV